LQACRSYLIFAFAKVTTRVISAQKFLPSQPAKFLSDTFFALLNLFSKLIIFFQSGANRAQEKVFFIGKISSDEPGSVVEVEGDPGQGRQEDRDLYTTRTA
jgi:hypothetical protein